MTILQGTMQDGTVIPVQVDAQGRLVAEGLQGAAGPPGPKGDAGGAFPLPPDPADEQLLMWRNGGLIWADIDPAPGPQAFINIASVKAYEVRLTGQSAVRNPTVEQARQILSDPHWNRTNPDGHKAGWSAAHIALKIQGEEVSVVWANRAVGSQIRVLLGSVVDTINPGEMVTVRGDITDGRRVYSHQAISYPDKQAHTFHAAAEHGVITVACEPDDAATWIYYIGFVE